MKIAEYIEKTKLLVEVIQQILDALLWYQVSVKIMQVVDVEKIAHEVLDEQMPETPAEHKEIFIKHFLETLNKYKNQSIFTSIHMETLETQEGKVPQETTPVEAENNVQGVPYPHDEDAPKTPAPESLGGGMANMLNQLMGGEVIEKMFDIAEQKVQKMQEPPATDDSAPEYLKINFENQVKAEIASKWFIKNNGNGIVTTPEDACAKANDFWVVFEKMCYQPLD
jgi:hypothetical protein